MGVWDSLGMLILNIMINTMFFFFCGVPHFQTNPEFWCCSEGTFMYFFQATYHGFAETDDSAPAEKVVVGG